MKDLIKFIVLLIVVPNLNILDEDLLKIKDQFRPLCLSSEITTNSIGIRLINKGIATYVFNIYDMEIRWVRHLLRNFVL